MSIRELNSFGFPGGFNISNNEPIDSRTKVTNILDVYNPESWKKIKPYNGLIVTDNNGNVLVCVNESAVIDEKSNKPIYCLEDSWKPLGEYSEDANLDNILENYWDSLEVVTSTSTPTPHTPPAYDLSETSKEKSNNVALSLTSAFSLFSSLPGPKFEAYKDNASQKAIDLNKIVTTGTYHIKGDNIFNNPLIQIDPQAGNSGHTIDAVLYVLDSSINSDDSSDKKVISQVIILSNRTGVDTNVYVRTGISAYNNSYDNFIWELWGKLQTNIEVMISDNNGYNSLVDNGIYSGIDTTNGDVFTMLTINNYAVAGMNNKNPRLTQIKFVVGLDNSFRFEKRSATKNGSNWNFETSWGSLTQTSWDSDVDDLTSEYWVTETYTSTGVPPVYDIKSDKKEQSNALPLSVTSAFNMMKSVPGMVLDYLNTSNNDVIDLNNIVTAGTYHIKADGHRINNNPLKQVDPQAGNSGHSIDAILYVLDSSLNNNTNGKVITQIIMLSNRTGVDGNIYTRTGFSTSATYNSGFTWESWGKLQTNIEVMINDDNGYKSLVDNGIYSGINKSNLDVFTMITINNYAVAGMNNKNPRLTQIKFVVGLDNSFRFEKRSATKNGSNWNFETSWSSLTQTSWDADIDDLTSEYWVTETYTSTGVPPVYDIKSDKKEQSNALPLSVTSAFNMMKSLPGMSLDYLNTSNNNTINLNDMIIAGTYHIKADGHRIANSPLIQLDPQAGNSGHSIDAVLYVLDSSLNNNTNGKVITQIIMLSNRTGTDGNIYIRTGFSTTPTYSSNFTWEPWGKLQTNIEVMISNINGTSYNSLVDNGIYSGIDANNGDVFTMITINNYAVAGMNGESPALTQIKFVVDLYGSFRFEKRSANKNGDTWSFQSSWESIFSEVNSGISNLENRVNSIGELVAEHENSFEALTIVIEQLQNRIAELEEALSINHIN